MNFIARFLFVIIVCTFLVSGCGKNNQKVSVLQGDDLILAFGDSLTEGKGVSPRHSYPTVLQRLSGLTVVNDGISGSVSQEGLARLQDALEEYNPELVIICYGGNDILRNQSEKQLKENLASMIEISQDFGTEVVLIALPKKSLFLASLPLYQELAEQYGVPLENEVLAELLANSSNRSDTVHLNEKGYRLMAEAVYDLLQKSDLLD